MKYYSVKICAWILKHSIWIKVICPTVIAVGAAFLNYDTTSLSELHPLRSSVLEFIIPMLPLSVIVSTVIYVAIIFVEEISKPKLDKLQQDLLEAKDKNRIVSERVNDLFDGYLYNLAGKLGFGSKDKNCERITLYIHDQDNAFVQCGRYSANPEYKGVGRTSYPDSEGCISMGWQNGWHFDSGFPCPENKRGDYIDFCHREYGIPRNTTKKIKMQSRLYAVYCIQKNGASLAVIVIESKSNERFDEGELKTTLTEQSEYLSYIIEGLRDYIPEPNTAKSAGL